MARASAAPRGGNPGSGGFTCAGREGSLSWSHNMLFCARQVSRLEQNYHCDRPYHDERAYDGGDQLCLAGCTGCCEIECAMKQSDHQEAPPVLLYNHVNTIAPARMPNKNPMTMAGL
jgi:hypothetical protein